MTLTNRTDVPPGGYTYMEPSLGWEAPAQAVYEGFNAVVRAMMKVRAQNPASGLNPSREACILALSEYTCARFAKTPKLLLHFCGGEPVTQQERAALDAARRAAVGPAGCASCGGRRRR
jgi:hypothetical protein